MLPLCEVIEVNRCSFYAWDAAPARAERAAADAELAERIRVVHQADKAYGVARVTAELNDGAPPGKRVNHKRVARVMAEHGIAGIRLRRRVRTTIPEPSEEKVPDLLKRDFTAEAPNRKYVGDITYLPLADGSNLYLATVIDCCSRKLAGWAVADHMRTDLVETALKAALADRGSLRGALFHADHGARGLTPGLGHAESSIVLGSEEILSKARKDYTDEFRRRSVDLYESTPGATLRGIADDLGSPGHAVGLGEDVRHGFDDCPDQQPADADGQAGDPSEKVAPVGGRGRGGFGTVRKIKGQGLAWTTTNQ